MLSDPASDLSISYLPAVVIHSNKYTKEGFKGFRTLMHDVVFKADNGNEYPITVRDLDLQLYPGQKVRLIIIDCLPIGFIDNATNEYFYLTNDLQQTLKRGFRINRIFLFGSVLLSAVLLTSYYKNMLFGYLFLVPVLYWLYLRIANYLLEKKIDKLILSE